MTNSVEALFLSGISLLSENLTSFGFVFVDLQSGESSGGEYASGRFVKDDRAINLSYRFRLGAVSYEMGPENMDHASFASASGVRGDYPGYPEDGDDTLDGFRRLDLDLRSWGTPFLKGDDLPWFKTAAAQGKWLP